MLFPAYAGVILKLDNNKMVNIPVPRVFVN